jgi:hypothetical protein
MTMSDDAVDLIVTTACIGFLLVLTAALIVGGVWVLGEFSCS